MPNSSLELIEFKSNLLEQAQECYRCRDLKGLLGKIDALEATSHESLAVEDRIKLDFRTAQVLSLAAEAHLDDLHFDECFELCAAAIDVLRSIAVAVEAANLPPRPCSLAWLGIIQILADAKWKNVSDVHDRCLVFEETLRRFSTASQNVVRSASKEGLDRAEVLTRKHTILGCAVMLLKQALRFEPNRAGCIALTAETVQSGVLQDAHLPYYWDIRILEYWLGGHFDRLSLEYHYQKREQCFRTMFPDRFDLTAYKESAAREMEHLLATHVT